MKNIHALIFTNQANYNLGALTDVRSMSSVPYGGRYRMIDFMLSNCINADISDIGVLLQQNYQSLLDHIGSGKHWDLARRRGGLRLLPPFSMEYKSHYEYRGRMDTLASLGSYLEQVRQDYVLLADGDMAINIDLGKVGDAHVDSGADITIVVSPKHIGDANLTTYVQYDEATGAVTDIIEKPDEKIEGYAEYLSMAILSKDLLVKLNKECKEHHKHSFSEDILAAKQGELKINVYKFDDYCTRFTSIASYFEKSMELLSSDVRKDLFNPAYPIRSKDRTDAPSYYAPESKVTNSMVSDGCMIHGTVENSILFRNVTVEAGAVVKNAILMKGVVVGAGAEIDTVIADKNVKFSAGTKAVAPAGYPQLFEKDAQV